MDNCDCYLCDLRGIDNRRIVCYAGNGNAMQIEKIITESKTKPWIVNFARTWEEVSTFLFFFLNF